MTRALFLAGAASAVALALSGSANAQLVIEEGFESGTLPYGCSGNCPVVVQVPDARAGDWVMKSELHEASDVSYRTEVSVSDSIINFDVGEDYWVGISIKLGTDFDDPRDFNDQGMVLQWHYRDWLHPEVRDAQPLLLRYRDDEVWVHNEVLQDYLANTPPDYGEWVDWVVHVKFDDVDGINEVWRNGTQVADFHGDTHQIEKHEGAYLKFGLYSAQYQTPPGVSFTRTVFHDELRVARSDGSYDAVAPPGAAGGPGSGGAGGAGAGGAGAGGAGAAGASAGGASSAGSAGASASGSGGGPSGSGGSAGVAMDGGAGSGTGGGAGGTLAPTEDAEGCACSHPGRSSKGSPALLLLAAVMFWVTGRRRIGVGV